MSTNSTTVYDPHARPKPHAFYPPNPNPLVIGWVHRGIRGSLRRKPRVTEVEISDEDLRVLRDFQSSRCLITPSHSGGFEPHVLMYLSSKMGCYFNFVAALEVFEQSPVNRWVMPRLGCYSILRGTIDRPSFTTTRKLLSEGARPLVIFPEGEAVGQNSLMVPFQLGVFQLAFKGLEDARRDEPEAVLHCIPMAIKYVYLRDMSNDIAESLARIEAQLALDPAERPTDPHARLRWISQAVLAANEKAQNIQPAEESTLDERIQFIRQEVVARLERQLNIVPNNEKPLLDRIRNLFNSVDRIVHEPPANSPYQQQLANERSRGARTLYDELWRLLKFVAVYDGYVTESLTVERFMDILALLEYEVLQKRHIWGPRKAVVRVGQPLDLAGHWEAYQADRRATVAQVTATVEENVRSMLREIGETHETPMVLSE